MTTYTASTHSTNRELSGSQIEEVLNNARPLTGGEIDALCTEAGLNRSQTRAIYKIAMSAPVTCIRIRKEVATLDVYAAAGSRAVYSSMIGQRGAIFGEIK